MTVQFVRVVGAAGVVVGGAVAAHLTTSICFELGKNIKGSQYNVYNLVKTRYSAGLIFGTVAGMVATSVFTNLVPILSHHPIPRYLTFICGTLATIGTGLWITNHTKKKSTK
jgi:hypothetical protein